MTHVKICGITSEADARAAIQAGASAIGLVFAHSPRQVSASVARRIVGAIEHRVPVIGVFQSQTPEHVATTCEECGLDYAQVHGSSFERHFAILKGKLIPAVTVQGGRLSVNLVDSPCRAVVLDAPHPNRLTGSATPFDWSLASVIAGERMVILAGGLHVDNVTSALDAARPYAVDVSSGVESSPGEKDHEKLFHFIKKVREWDFQIHGDISADTEADSFLRHL